MPPVRPVWSHRLRASVRVLAVLLIGSLTARAQLLTNLNQLVQTLNLQQSMTRAVRLDVTVCAASRPKTGVLIVQDESGVALLQVGSFEQEIEPGDTIQIAGNSCLLRNRETGIEISAAPVVNDDGLHYPRTAGGVVTLKQGPVPIRLEWFNNLRALLLDVSCTVSNSLTVNFGASNLWHAVLNEPGQTNYLPGLRAECFEGYWEALPNFDLMQPVKSGIVTNFGTGFRTRDEMVGIRFTGIFDAPYDGQYSFRVRSDDGSLLFLGNTRPALIRTGRKYPPLAGRGSCGETMGSLTERRWITVEGRVHFVTSRAEGFDLELRSDRDVLSVWVTDTTGLDPRRLLNARVRVTGVGRGVLTPDERIILGRLCVANAKEIEILETPTARQQPLPIIPISQVQGMPLEDARRSSPVRVRGVVTDIRTALSLNRMSIQDETRGIFVRLPQITNTIPVEGDFLEIEGRSDAGDFAPIIVANKITLLGKGRLPEPVRPTWTELLDGSMDVQWAELRGLVTAVQSNTVTLLLPEGRLDIQMNNYEELELKALEKAIVRIRGVLFAVWNAQTHEVRVGQVLMRNAKAIIETPPPADPFAVVPKTLRELLLFDAQASAFRRVKVSGQIIYADATQMFLAQDGVGLRLLPAQSNRLTPGDLVEAVGHLGIDRTGLVLREAQLRKTGVALLPPARKLAEAEMTQEGLDTIRVRVQGHLLGWHTELGALVLEMQTGAQFYLARFAPGKAPPLSLRTGSWLALEGVYVGRANQKEADAATESFQLLLNSPADITVLSQPSWWTLPRLLALMGMLLVILVFTIIWNSQLRRLVEQRTAQLRRETRERERIEHQRALETERSRIARDLHDDLGSSLTEITVLASTGQFPQTGDVSHPNLFQIIGTKARSLITALDVIVWAVDPEDNSLQSLADYLSGYTEEFFSHTNITCRFKVPVSFPPITLEGRIRHDLLMVVKEALNNVVRHAEASAVEFGLAMADDILEIEIADNGKGIDSQTAREGHGLKNQSARLLALGGSWAVETRPGGGTRVFIRLPLATSLKPA